MSAARDAVSHSPVEFGPNLTLLVSAETFVQRFHDCLLLVGAAAVGRFHLHVTTKAAL